MHGFIVVRTFICALASCAIAGLATSAARAETGTVYLPTGQSLTPTAAPGAVYQRLQTELRADENADVNGAVATALSPDGSALLALASGYNSGFFTTSGRPIRLHRTGSRHRSRIDDDHGKRTVGLRVRSARPGRSCASASTFRKPIALSVGRAMAVRSPFRAVRTIRVYAFRATGSKAHTTVSMLATIEDLLGVRPLGFNDANAMPMEDAFTTVPQSAPYDAVIPGNLCRSPVDPNLVPDYRNANVAQRRPLAERRSPGWWTAQTKSFDFRGPDRINTRKFNRVLWRGQMGDEPRPR